MARKLLKEGKKEYIYLIILLVCFILIQTVFLLLSRAKLLLKKKRYQEQLVEKTDKQLDTVERLVHDLEFTQVEMQVRTILYHRLT